MRVRVRGSSAGFVGKSKRTDNSYGTNKHTITQLLIKYLFYILQSYKCERLIGERKHLWYFGLLRWLLSP